MKKYKLDKRMTKSEREWYKNFNYAMRNDPRKVSNLNVSGPEALTLYRDLEKKRGARRRDITHVGARTQLFDDPASSDLYTENSEYRNSEHEMSAKSWEGGLDYQTWDYSGRSVSHDMEVIIDTPKLRERSQPKRFPLLGEKVRVHIPGHYYHGQVAEVVENRGNIQFLLKILTKKPHRIGKKTKREQETPDGYMRIGAEYLTQLGKFYERK